MCLVIVYLDLINLPSNSYNLISCFVKYIKIKGNLGTHWTAYCVVGTHGTAYCVVGTHGTAYCVVKQVHPAVFIQLQDHSE